MTAFGVLAAATGFAVALPRLRPTRLATSSDSADGASKVDTTDSTAVRANALLQTQCDAGSAVACDMIGENLLGSGTSADRAKGIALLKKACEGGFERACEKLGGGGTR